MFEFLQYDFMIRAFIAGIIVAVIAPLIGNFLVVRRYALMSDTLAHISLVGVAVGLLTKFNPILTATITAVISAIGIEKLRTKKSIYGESALALFLSGSLAVAVVLVSIARGFNTDLFSYLFGSISTVSQYDLYVIGALGAIALIMILIFYKELFYVSFDEELAKANGVNAKAFNIILIILAAITVAVSMRIVGVLLIGALMVIPVITAIQFGKSFRETLFLSVAISFLAVIIGLVLSYYLDLASGGTIVIVAIGFFLLSLILGRKNY